uniref:Uncharacterized protein n=1 Tax=Knipowitschia caucasica TaxID=637954 RepID=A0AAV2JXJ8_KNICA
MGVHVSGVAGLEGRGMLVVQCPGRALFLWAPSGKDLGDNVTCEPAVQGLDKAPSDTAVQQTGRGSADKTPTHCLIHLFGRAEGTGRQEPQLQTGATAADRSHSCRQEPQLQTGAIAADRSHCCRQEPQLQTGATAADSSHSYRQEP